MLTSEQIRAFDRDGYLKLPHLITAAEVQGLRSAVDGLVAALPANINDWPEDFHHGGLFGDDIGAGHELCRLEYTFGKHPSFLILLGNPRLLEVPLSLHDGPSLVTWEDLVVKTPHAYTVPMHQDALFQSVNSRVFSVGVYLDASYEDPLLVLPGTHRLGPLGEDEVSGIARERKDEVIAVPVDAGDAIVHNVRMIHGSDSNAGSRPRRVLYLEFRTVEQVRQDSPWSESWLSRRLPYIPLATELRAASELARDDDPRLMVELRQRRPEWFSGRAGTREDVDLRVHHHDFTS